jgi:glycosyltransferase involved in cell wall biosynthesis
VGHLVEGAAAQGTVTFCICVPVAAYGAALQMLRRLSAREGIDWTLAIAGVGVSGLSPAEAAQPFGKAARAVPGGSWLSRRPPAHMRWLLLVLMLLAVPLQFVRALLRPLWRLMWRNGLSVMPVLLRTTRLAWSDPATAAAAIAPVLEQQSWVSLRRLGRTLRVWSAESEDDTIISDAPAPPLRALPITDGWLLLSADCVGGLQLPGRKIALMADLIPCDGPFSWISSNQQAARRWNSWKRRTAGTLAGADGVITLSRHVAERHTIKVFGVAEAKVTPLRPPMADLLPLLPECPPDRVPTPVSRRAAAHILRQHALERGWTYLEDFPFEDVCYIVVSALDGPLQNIGQVVEAVRILLRRKYVDIKLLTTTPREYNAASGHFWRVVDDEGLQFDVLSVPNLPRKVLAALYHCAAVTVHPAFVDAGAGSHSCAESISVGTPGLMACGPHSLELLEEEPTLQPFLFDPYSPEALADAVRRVLSDRQEALALQQAIHARGTRRGWADVAQEYAAVIAGQSACKAAFSEPSSRPSNICRDLRR